MSVRLSDDELWDFLEQGHTAIFTSLRRDGRPVSLPVWYAVLDRSIYLRGPAQTKKFERVRHDDRVAFLVESGRAWVELKAVHVSGRARFVTDPDEVERVEAEIERKYAAYRVLRSAMPDATQKHYTTRGSALLRIEPEGRILTWDNANLRLKE